ncbi:L,D-transpeptidase [Lactiplantibacillus plajomi]|nr:L,D-transpeptidase [Lactiplantibacillus plajomi]
MKAQAVLIATGAMVAGVMIWGTSNNIRGHQLTSHPVTEKTRAASQTSKKIQLAKKAKPRSQKTTPVDWHGPSMPDKAYPDLAQHPNLTIKVSTKRQRVYLVDQGKTLYTMLASTGKSGSETPRGQFVIQPERGPNFYNQQSKEGANYWVSFKDHGIYLFHSVPVDATGTYVKSEAAQLGKEANSHGCVRLSIADAKWMYENIRQGTPVTVN